VIASEPRLLQADASNVPLVNKREVRRLLLASCRFIAVITRLQCGDEQMASDVRRNSPVVGRRCSSYDEVCSAHLLQALNLLGLRGSWPLHGLDHLGWAAGAQRGRTFSVAVECNRGAEYAVSEWDAVHSLPCSNGSAESKRTISKLD
jgi:hypothetical protein